MPRPGKDIPTTTRRRRRVPLALGVPREIVVEPVTRPRKVFRVTFATDLADRDALLLSLNSNRELGRKPRKIELVYNILHLAISTWTTEAAAYANAHRWPRNGDHIARLDLVPGLGFCVDRPPQDGDEHRSLWAPPDQILRCVADLKRV